MNWRLLAIHAIYQQSVSETWGYIELTNLFLAESAMVLNLSVVPFEMERQVHQVAAVLPVPKEHQPCPWLLVPNYPWIQKQVAYSKGARQSFGCHSQAVRALGVARRHLPSAALLASEALERSHRGSCPQVKTFDPGHFEQDKMVPQVELAGVTQHCSVAGRPSLVDHQLAGRLHHPIARPVDLLWQELKAWVYRPPSKRTERCSLEELGLQTCHWSLADHQKTRLVVGHRRKKMVVVPWMTVPQIQMVVGARELHTHGIEEVGELGQIDHSEAVRRIARALLEAARIAIPVVQVAGNYHSLDILPGQRVGAVLHHQKAVDHILVTEEVVAAVVVDWDNMGTT